jgi:hypothetical protein
MEMILSRRNFVRSSALAAAAYATSKALPVAAQATDAASPVRLGVASYTFRNFNRAQLIGYMKQLNVLALNAKDVKDHLPMDPAFSSMLRVRSISIKTKMPTSAISLSTASERASGSLSLATPRRGLFHASRSS